MDSYSQACNIKNSNLRGRKILIKKRHLILFIVIFICCISTITISHSPTIVNNTYDKNGIILTVDVNHVIEEGDITHYIETVEIRVNGELKNQEEHTSKSGIGVVCSPMI